MEEAHKRTELGFVAYCAVISDRLLFFICRRVLLHQHKARMRRKSQQIQDELVGVLSDTDMRQTTCMFASLKELDMKILSDLVEKVNSKLSLVFWLLSSSH